MDTFISILTLLGIAVVAGFAGALVIWLCSTTKTTTIDITIIKKDDEDDNKDNQV